MNKINLKLFIVFFTLTSGLLTAQERQTIRTSERSINVGELADYEIQYLYPEKTEGTVIYNNGEKAAYNMNYNILVEEMHFRTEDGELRAFEEDAPIDKIIAGDDTFIYGKEKGFLEVIHSGKINLYLKHKINISTLPIKRGAYGGTDYTSNIEEAIIHQPTSPYQKSEVRIDNQAKQEMDVTLRYNKSFLFVENGETTEVRRRRHVLRKFSDHRRDIRSYCRENNIDFDEKDDVAKLAQYIETLY